MVPVEQVRAAPCGTCGARPEEPCVVHAHPHHGLHATRQLGLDGPCPTCEAQPFEVCVSYERLVRITAGVEVHPQRWVIAVAAYARAIA